ncbi:hypothetical protein B0T20DRAFT_242117 [Sordaria brevicollis]|uniref:Uncharacterized protein n=1 Tax=Sordaria brevicollis TaxID=83679 RepID=A0AAE0PB46_SORBR|nr:hypothetical protein B0T20DRAFT_242117 [Sordaria brevicollis]
MRFFAQIGAVSTYATMSLPCALSLRLSRDQCRLTLEAPICRQLSSVPFYTFSRQLNNTNNGDAAEEVIRTSTNSLLIILFCFVKHICSLIFVRFSGLDDIPSITHWLDLTTRQVDSLLSGVKIPPIKPATAETEAPCLAHHPTFNTDNLQP